MESPTTALKVHLMGADWRLKSLEYFHLAFPEPRSASFASSKPVSTPSSGLITPVTLDALSLVSAVKTTFTVSEPFTTIGSGFTETPLTAGSTMLVPADAAVTGPATRVAMPSAATTATRMRLTIRAFRPSRWLHAA